MMWMGRENVLQGLCIPLRSEATQDRSRGPARKKRISQYNKETE